MTDKESSLDRLSKQLTTSQLEHERDFINDLVETVVPPMAKIPEPVFREIFMPYFLGEKKATQEDSAVYHWSGLVGSGTAAAEVVNVKGETLFVVPPLFDSGKINAQRPTRTSYATIFTVTEEEARVHPGRARDYLVQQLSQKADAALSTEKTEQYSWQPILEYYGLAPKNEQASKNPAANNTDDDFVYD